MYVAHRGVLDREVRKASKEKEDRKEEKGQKDRQALWVHLEEVVSKGLWDHLE